jgi:hypothetical protein
MPLTKGTLVYTKQLEDVGDRFFSNRFGKIIRVYATSEPDSTTHYSYLVQIPEISSDTDSGEYEFTEVELIPISFNILRTKLFKLVSTYL